MLMHWLSVYIHIALDKPSHNQKVATIYHLIHGEPEVFPGQIRYSNPSSRLWIYSGVFSQ